MAYEDTGGIPVAPGGAPGALITTVGQVQFGDMLLGSGTSAGWRELVEWRNLPDSTPSDSPRPQAHGAYPGSVYGESLVVTFTCQVRGTPEAKALALATLERYGRLGVEHVLAVNDADDGVWFRNARVIARNVPQGKHFRHAPVECSFQFLCADPRRFNLTERVGVIALPANTGGLDYPLVYPLDYGTAISGSFVATNDGSEDTPMVAVFNGPLTSPTLSTGAWSMTWDMTLADGETLTVDTGAGTALLNGNADRLYQLSTASDPLPACLLAPGENDMALTATSGTGTVTVTYRDARM